MPLSNLLFHVNVCPIPLDGFFPVILPDCLSRAIGAIFLEASVNGVLFTASDADILTSKGADSASTFLAFVLSVPLSRYFQTASWAILGGWPS